jgi:hypothetical protein
MAQTIMCDMCKAEPAVMLQSNVTTGETIAVGDGCMFPYFYTQAMELAPEGTFATPDEEPEEKPKTPRKRAAKTKTETQPVDEPDDLDRLNQAVNDEHEANTIAPPF